MNTKSLFMTILVALIVGVILITGVMVPALSNLTTGTKTETETIYTDYVNEGIAFALTGTDGTPHIISITPTTDSYIIQTDNVQTGELEKYVPVVGVAPAIAIGVYESYVDGDTLVSQANRTVSGAKTVDAYRDNALNNNEGVDFGTYQLWNFYQSTLMKIMGLTVMGNADSQYMMGDGRVGTPAQSITGATSAAYQKGASNTESISMFIEDIWGSINEPIGDTYLNNRSLVAGNTLGGHDIQSVVGTNTAIKLPSTGMIGRISTDPDTFGVPTSTKTNTASGYINDKVTSSTGKSILCVGGGWNGRVDAGLFSMWNYETSTTYFLPRLAYVLTSEMPESTAEYGYSIEVDMNSGNTRVAYEGIKVLENGTLTPKMPTNTTLNSYWDFDSTTGIGPFGAYYVAINLSDGANADDTSEPRISTTKGEIAYKLNPYNLKQTLAGHTFDPTSYNVMIVIPTVYWGHTYDTIYVGSSPDMFDGVTMVPYAHTYTIDPNVNTKNRSLPVDASIQSTTIAIGTDTLVKLYADGMIKVITSENTDAIDISTSSNAVELTVTDDVLSYTDSSSATKTRSGISVYLASVGDMVMTDAPYVEGESQIAIGDYIENLETTSHEKIGVGYCIATKYENLQDISPSILDPEGAITSTGTQIEIDSTDLNTGAYTLNEVKVINTWSDESTSEVSYDMFIVPASFTAETTVEHEVPTTPDGALGAMVGLIPLLMVVGLVFFTVGYAIKSR